MDGLKGIIFLDIQQRLASQVPDIKFIDLDTGQLEYKKEDMRPAVLLPCALIDFVHVDYDELSGYAQIATATVRVRLAVDPFTQATHYFSDPQKETALNFFNLEHNANKALHGYANTEYYTPLARKRVQTELRNDKLRVIVMDYTTSFNDDTAMIVPASTVARPDLAIDVDTPI